MTHDEILLTLNGIREEYKLSEQQFTREMMINVIDSLDYVTMVIAVEERWGIVVPDEAISHVKTVGDVVDVLYEFHPK